MKKILLLIATIIVTINGYTQTNLSAGDIAFLGSNTDGATNLDDSFAFVLLKDIDAATTIIFTDRGWNDSTNSFFNYPGDGELTWTSGVDRSKGDIVTLDLSSLNPVSTAYSYIGDQLFAIQGSISTPIFIAGLQFNNVASGGDDANWDGAAIDNATSALPNDLVTGDTAVRLVNASNLEQDNWQFSCALAGANPIEGSPEQIRAILHNRNNWVSNDTSVYSPAVEVGCAVSVLDNCQTSDATTAFSDETNDGFGNWSFTTTGNSGNFTASSTNNGDGDSNGDGDINSSGTAWGLFANSGQIAELIRPFDSPLGAGDTFSIQMDNGWIESGGVVGFSLRNNSGENLLEFYYSNGQPSYTIDNLNGAEGTGIGFTDEGLQFDMTMTSSNTVDITITELFNGTTHNFSKSLKNPAGGQVISFLRMFNFNAGFNAERNAYFNNLEVCTAPGVDNDGDGFNDDVDCDDNDSTINPGATEINFNGIDDDCNPDTLDENSGIFESYVVINNTYYDLQSDTGNPDFNGFDLGNLTCTDALVINGAQNKVYKCDTGDITNGKLFYRVYETGGTEGAFTELNLGFLSNDGGAPSGCQNQTWETVSHNVDILGSLAVGSYTLDVYTSADYTHATGNGSHIADNEGLFYTATFSIYNNPPTAVCNDITVELDATGNYTLTQADIDAIGAGSSDNCTSAGNLAFAISDTNFNCDDVSSGGDTTPSIWINELHYDNEGDDEDEAIEVVANFDAASFSVVLYNGSGGVTYGSTLDLGSDFTLNTVSGFYIYSIFLPPNGLQNGAPDGLALIDGDGIVVEFINYEGGTFTATNGPASGSTSVNIGVSENSSTLVGTSLQKTGSGSDASAFTWGGSRDATLGAPNSGQTLIGSSGGNEVTLTVTDENGNSATCTATVTVEDNTAPNAFCQNVTVQLDSSGNGSITAEQVDNGSNDNCAVASMELSQTEFNCSHIGQTNTVTLLVTDTSGNTASCTANVTVLDEVAPTVVCNDITVELDPSGNYTLSQTDIEAIGAGSSDACGEVTFNVDNASFDCSDVASTAPASNDLFISEYMEGSSNNKCLEIYNGTGNTVDLSNYSLRFYFNGNTSPGNIIALSGNLNNGDVFVVCDNDATIISGDLNNNGSFYNGDDAIELLNNTNTIDVIGQIGFDPGSEWGSGLVSTQNNTIRRKASVTDGDSNGTDVFDPSSEWDGFDIDTIDGFGSHLVGGGSSPVVTLTVTDENGNVATCTATITVEDNIAPTVVCNPLEVELDDNGEYALSESDINEIADGSFDGCGIADISVSPNTFSCADAGEVVDVVLTVTDVNGNSSTCDSVILVEDVTEPTVVCNDITVQLDASGNYTLTQADIDAIGAGSSDACGIASLSVSNTEFDCSDVVVTQVQENVWINEVHYDNAGTDQGEFIEVVSNFDASSYSVVLYNGSNGTSYNTLDLNSATISTAAGFTFYAINLPTNGLQNGSPDGFALIDGGGMVVEFLSYEGALTATDGPANGLTSTDIGVAEDGGTPASFSLQLTGSGSSAADFTWAAPASNTNGAANNGQTLTLGPDSPPVITLTVTDINGNSATCTATVTVLDSVLPTVVCNNLTVELDDSGNYTLTEEDIDAIANGSSDACGIASFSVSPDSFTCGEIGNNTVTLTVTDNNGNINTCTSTITVMDTTAPVVICQDITVQLDANGSASIVAADIDGGSFDTCSAVSLDINQNAFDCDDVNATVAINDLFISEYIEGSGNNKCIEIFNGTGSPVNLANYSLVRYSNGTTSGTNINLSGTIANGDVHVICNSSADGPFLAQADQTTGSVSHNGDDAYELVNNGVIIDIFGSVGEDPGAEWNVAGNETQDRTLRRNITVTKGNINNIVGFPSLGSEWTEYGQNNLDDLGSHTVDARGVEVTLTVTDAYGNTNSCVAIVRVEDNITPEITCVPNTTLDTDPGVCDYTVVADELDATFTDNCSSGSITNDYNNSSSLAGAIFPQGTTLVTWTVDDGNGQVVSCTTEVTVEDNEAPVVNCLSLQVQLDEFGNGSITEDDIDGDSYDNCEIASITLSQTDFDCSDIGGDLDGLIISEYIDGAGDNDCVEIFNGTGNTVNLFGDNYVLRVYANGGTTALYEVPLLGTIADRDVYVLCFGNNDGAGQADQIAGFAFDGNDAVALVKAGNAVDVVGVIGDNPGSGWSSGGVTTAGTTLVRNVDVLQGNINAFVANMATEWTQFPQGTYGNLGAHDIEITDLANNVILTVTDTSGNVSTCEGNVTVVDLVPPVPACQDITVQLGVDGTATVAPSQVDNGSTDVCGIATLELDITEFNCDNIGANPVVLTVTDVNGNTATCSATVTIEDNVAPTVVTQNITVQLDDQGNASIEALDVDGGSNDACGIDTYAVTPNSFDCSNIGENTVTLTVTDIHGNAASETAVVTVEDNVNPIAVCNDISIYLNPDGTYTLSQADIDAIADGSTDNCDTDLTYSVSPDSFTCAEEGDNTVTLTVTDNYGNSSTCTATVTVDGSFPEVNITQSELPEFCQGAVVVLTANSDEAVEYLWNSGEETASIEVDGNGIYGVLVTSATNCTAYAEFEVTGFDAGSLVSAYTILAEEEVFLHGNNLVQSGAVGAMNLNTGNIKLHQATTVVDFAQAVSLDLNQGSVVTGGWNPVAANPTIPPFVFNTLSNTSSPNVTVNNNQTQTLTGSVYDVITVKQNATVIFTQSNVYINELKTFDGASIEFENCANVFINEKFMLAQNGTINADDPNKVVFYVNQDVQIEKGSYVRASIHAYFHELLVKGNQTGSPTYMTGLFIANRVHGNKNVLWNADDLCDPCPIDQQVGGSEDVSDNNNLRLGIEMEITAWPNPSNSNFNLRLKTAVSQEEVEVLVYDMNNRLVHKGHFKYDNTHTFGDKLDGGVYIVKVTQSGITKSVRLVRY